MRPILASLVGMAYSKKDYLSNFNNQHWSVVEHLLKILIIQDFRNEGHWVDEVDTILSRLASDTCVVKVSRDELEYSFVQYDPSIGREWALISKYFKSSKNSQKSGYIYLNGLKACKRIPDILKEFIRKRNGFVSIEKLTAFKESLKDRGTDVKLINYSQLTKLKNKCLC